MSNWVVENGSENFRYVTLIMELNFKKFSQK